MSTKFDTLLKNSREGFEIAKETFLDALADFLTDNKTSVIRGDHFSFSIRMNMSGADEAGCPRYKVSFAPHLIGISLDEAHKNPQLLVYTTLAPSAIEKFIKSEYNAKIECIQANTVFTYLKFNLPFV